MASQSRSRKVLRTDGRMHGRSSVRKLLEGIEEGVKASVEEVSDLRLTIIEAMESPEWFGPFFEGKSWDRWKVFLKAIFCLPMTAGEIRIYQEFTGRTAVPEEAVREAWMVVGRRGGKTRISALIALYLAIFRDYGQCLAPGEMATIPVISSDEEQTRQCLWYLRDMVNKIPNIRERVTKQLARSISIGRVLIEVHVSSYRSVRGYTVVAALCDEIAYWHNEEHSKNPDVEVLRALRPGMLTIPGAILLGMSSPYARRGVLWDAFDQHHGKDGDRILVWKASTLSMRVGQERDNPEAWRHINGLITDAYHEDPIAADAEYGAAFRTDVAGYLLAEAVDAVTVPGRVELPPLPNRVYRAFCDPSGGSSDSFTMAIGHKDEKGNVVIDIVLERRAPLSPKDVTAEFATVLRRYGCGCVHGDLYAAAYAREEFRANQITYITDGTTKNDLYVDLLPLINSRVIQLPDNKRLRNQLLELRRATAKSGKDTIDHPKGGHDDVANAVAGCAGLVATELAWRTLDLSQGTDQHISAESPFPPPRVNGKTCRMCPNFQPGDGNRGKCKLHVGFIIGADQLACHAFGMELSMSDVHALAGGFIFTG